MNNAVTVEFERNTEKLFDSSQRSWLLQSRRETLRGPRQEEFFQTAASSTPTLPRPSFRPFASCPDRNAPFASFSATLAYVLDTFCHTIKNGNTMLINQVHSSGRTFRISGSK